MTYNRQFKIMKAALAAIINIKGIKSPNSPRLRQGLARFATNPEFKDLEVTLREVIKLYSILSKEALRVNCLLRNKGVGKR
jgi:hypothetical protein